jgi:hypothetical protein
MSAQPSVWSVVLCCLMGTAGGSVIFALNYYVDAGGRLGYHNLAISLSIAASIAVIGTVAIIIGWYKK